MTQKDILKPDDAFILGNICGLAIVNGHGGDIQAVLRAMQAERPRNAGGFLMQALYMCEQEKYFEALEFIEKSPIFEADDNRDEALAFHIVLLHTTGHFDKALTLGKALLENPKFTSESAHYTVRKLIEGNQSNRNVPIIKSS